VAELVYNAGPTKNDLPILNSFPFLPNPHRGYDYVKQLTATAPSAAGLSAVQGDVMGLSAPEGFMLEQNYPNPFNPSTEIRYHVSVSAPVTLKVFNIRGQEVATLVNSEQSAGTHTAVWNATNVASGTYFYRLQVGNHIVSTMKALVMK
jgi:hypothetical protein